MANAPESGEKNQLGRGVNGERNIPISPNSSSDEDQVQKDEHRMSVEVEDFSASGILRS